MAIIGIIAILSAIWAGFWFWFCEFKECELGTNNQNYDII